MKLYEIADQYKTLLAFDFEADQDNEAFSLLLAELDGKLEEKCDNIGKIVREWEFDADNLQAEIARLQARKKSIQTKIENLKSYTQNILTFMGAKKVEGDLFTLAIQKNPKSVKITGNVFDERFYETKRELSKTKLKDALDAGEIIEGAELEQKESLRIK